ncbi:MAG: histidine triad nucleotide-binding protein [Acidobacteria bacterium]|nr:histidine triad nucleotide-binding protein [Acidobacteriota bacterium]
MADPNNIFLKIARREIPADIVFEDDQCVAFRDINPQAPVHILVIPRKPLESISEATGEDTQLLGHLLRVAAQIAQTTGIAETGYRVVVNTGRNAGQTVFQLHVHVLGGRDLGWPPG